MMLDDADIIKSYGGRVEDYTSDEVGAITHTIRQGRSKLLDLLTYFILDRSEIIKLVDSFNFDEITNKVMAELSQMSQSEKEAAAERIRAFRADFGAQLHEVNSIKKSMLRRNNLTAHYSETTFDENTLPWLLEKVLFKLSSDIIESSKE